MRKWVRWGVSLALLLSGVSLAAHQLWAGEPTEAIRSATDQVIEVLKNPDLKTKPDVRDQKIWDIVSGQFDFEEMARRSLATHWRDRTAAEQKEFVDLFGHLIQRSYSGKLAQYTDERVEYVNEDVEGPRAEVKTKIISKGMEIPIDFRLMEKSSKWMVYDVSIEGVSLVNNYRNQFNRIVVSSGYNELIKRLRTKWDDLIKETEKQKKEST